MYDRLCKRMKHLFRMETGITLIEMAVVVVVTGIIIVAILPYIKVNVNSYTSISMGKHTTQSARIAFSRMLSEMKMVERWQDLDVCRSSRISFDIPGESNIYYRFTDGVLTRNDEIFLELVHRFVLKYYESDGTDMGSWFWDYWNIWRIEIEMEVGDGENNLVLQGQVSPRGIHYN